MQQQDKSYTTHQDDIIVSGIGNQTTFTNCTFSKINYNGDGAAFCADISSGGKLLIKDSKFIECKAIGDESIGGAIYLYINNEGQASISNSSFNQCEARYGGGINTYLLDENSILELASLRFENCSAEYGGGLYSIVSEGHLSITGLTLFQNCVSNQNGGGFYLQIQGGNVNFSSTDQILFDNCQGKHGGGLLVIAEDDNTLATGEAIESGNLITVNGTINLYYNNTFSNIQLSEAGNGTAINADLQTGSQLLIKDSQFIQCKGSSDGGAIYLNINNEEQATISNSSFDQCEAQQGGGIYASVSSLNSKLELESVVFENCKGGGVNLRIDTGGKVSISNSSFSNCEANQGGGIRVDMQNYNSYLELTNLSFENCSASDGGGLTIFAQDGPKFSINGKTSFKNCSSITDGGGFNTKCNNTGEQINMTGQLEYEKCTSNRGGGMYVICRAYAIIVINQLSFKDCSSSGQGGGLYVYSFASQFNVTGQSLFKNCTSEKGGGIY
ncbi:MAG: hypothetical protein EZS28_029923, partial [Streblomastix strix]